ncbi:MAG: hypothetical protein JXB32_01580 [Deltaproteobacteria bacterium]|nr:hypothetical protein [Deltaproteobacteria bacterium]
MKRLLLVVGLAGPACYQSFSDGDGGAEDARDDARTDVRDAAEVRDDADTADAADVPWWDGAECVTDDDCVVALEEDRCCQPNPVAVSRARLAADPCLHALGAVWTPSGDPTCHVLCTACENLARRYYAARCVEGTCVGVEDFCEPMTTPTTAGLFYASITPRGGWEQYRGQVITVRGWDLLGPDSCACCFGCPCDCLLNPVQHTLDCTMALRGSTCGRAWGCTGDECSPSCSPPYPMGTVVTEGYLVDSEADGWELWPTVSWPECPPAGPNPEGAPCDVMGDDPHGCAEGLVCFYWGDEITACDGECRPYGTECTVDDDCAGDDVCHLGYCVWCCPG